MVNGLNALKVHFYSMTSQNIIPVMDPQTPIVAQIVPHQIALEMAQCHIKRNQLIRKAKKNI